MTETAIAVATSPPGRRWRVIYFAVAILAAVVVTFANESISGFLAASPLNASVALIVLLPFLAIATRPIYVRVAQRNESHRTIGIVWALRTRSFRFFARTIGVWLLLMLVFGASSVAMFKQGGEVAVATLSNWLYVASLFTLIVHVLPSEARLPPAKAVRVIVLGPDGAGKTNFIGLAPVDRVSAENDRWSVTSSSASAAMTAALYKTKGGVVSNPATPLRHTVSRRRIWSQFTGVRPVPVDFVELPARAQPDAALRDGNRTAYAIVVAHPVRAANVRQQLDRIRKIEGRPKGKLRAAIAIVVTRCDDAALRTAGAILLDQETIEILQESARRWSAFPTTDRARASDGTDPEGFAPAGQVKAIAWLLSSL
jgi:hypothetical protein